MILSFLRKSSSIGRKGKRMNEKKGYSYTVEDEKIIEYMKLSTEQKLQWLEEINTFTYLALSDEEKLIRQKLRSAEI